MFFQRFKHMVSLISHQQAEAEHWDLPNTEIFQSKDVASAIYKIKFPIILELPPLGTTNV
jgi:hypothetical protein